MPSMGFRADWTLASLNAWSQELSQIEKDDSVYEALCPDHHQYAVEPSFSARKGGTADHRPLVVFDPAFQGGAGCFAQ